VTKGQRGHVQHVVDRHSVLIQKKYTAGQKEHGGNCWEKPGMLAHALDEAADLPVYLYTLRDQIEAVAVGLREGSMTASEGADALDRLLNK
jgi:hypothetical protein